MKAPNLTHILRKKSNIDPQLILGGGSFLVTFLNPYSYALSRNNSGLLAEFDAIYIDGISLVWLMKLLGMPCRRLSFDMTSMAKDLFEQLNLSGALM